MQHDPFQVSDEDSPSCRKFEFIVEKHGTLLTKYKKYLLIKNGEEVHSAVVRTKNRAGVHPILPGIDLIISNYRTVFMLKSSDGRQKMHAMLEFRSARPGVECRRRVKVEFPGDKILPEKLESMDSIVNIQDLQHTKSPKNLCLSCVGDSTPVIAICAMSSGKFAVSTTLDIDCSTIFGILVSNDIAKIPKSA